MAFIRNVNPWWIDRMILGRSNKELTLSYNILYYQLEQSTRDFGPRSSAWTLLLLYWYKITNLHWNVILFAELSRTTCLYWHLANWLCLLSHCRINLYSSHDGHARKVCGYSAKRLYLDQSPHKAEPLLNVTHCAFMYRHVQQSNWLPQWVFEDNHTLNRRDQFM